MVISLPATSNQNIWTGNYTFIWSGLNVTHDRVTIRYIATVRELGNKSIKVKAKMNVNFTKKRAVDQ